VFVYSRPFYLFLDEKVFLIQYKRCIDTRFSKCLSQKFVAFTAIVWLIQLSEYVEITYITRENSEFSIYVAPIKPRSHRLLPEAFLNVKNSLHS